MMNTQTRRSPLLSAAAAGTGVVLVAYAGADVATTPAPLGTVAPATISFGNNGNNDFYVKEPYDWFREKNPQVTVEFQGLPGGAAYLEKMLALLEAAITLALDGQKSIQQVATDTAPQLQQLLNQGKGVPDLKK